MASVGYPVEVGEREARAAGTDLRISTKDSRVVCSRVNGMRVDEAKEFLTGLEEREADIDGKNYSKAASRIRGVIESAEKNAEDQGLGDLRIRTITAEDGPNRLRAKRSQGKRGKEFKMTHVKVVLEEVSEE